MVTSHRCWGRLRSDVVNTRHGRVQFPLDLLFPLLPVFMFCHFCWLLWLTRQFGDVWLFIISEGVTGTGIKILYIGLIFLEGVFIYLFIYFSYPMTFTLYSLSVNRLILKLGALPYQCSPLRFYVNVYVSQALTANLVGVFFFRFFFSCTSSWTRAPTCLCISIIVITMPLVSTSSSSMLYVSYPIQERLRYHTEPTVNHHHPGPHAWQLFVPPNRAGCWSALLSLSLRSNQQRACTCWWVVLLIYHSALTRLPSGHESLCPLLWQLGFRPAAPFTGPESCQSCLWLWLLPRHCDYDGGLSDLTAAICQDYCLLAQQMSTRKPTSS